MVTFVPWCCYNRTTGTLSPILLGQSDNESVGFVPNICCAFCSLIKCTLFYRNKAADAFRRIKN